MRKLIIVFALITITGVSLFGQTSNHGNDSNNTQKQTDNFCELCKERLTAKLIYNPGIIRLEIDEHKKVIEVGFRTEQNSSSNILKIIENAGYNKVEIIEQHAERIKLKVDVCHFERAQLAQNE